MAIKELQDNIDRASTAKADVGIVGGGVAGMMSALLLARQGISVTLYERNEVLGGRLAYEQFEHESKSYRIDRGPTIVLLPHTIKTLLEEAGITDKAYTFLPLDPMYRIHHRDGSVLTKWRDAQRMAEELERFAPGEGAGFLRYMADMKPTFESGKTAFLEKSFVRKRDFFTMKNIRLLAKLSIHKNARQLAAQYFKNEHVIDAFSLQTLYIGGLPTGSPSLYSFIPFAEHEFGIWYVKGGYASLVQAMEQALLREGVQIVKGSKAEIKRIVVSPEKKLSGVVTVEDHYHAHEAVLFNGDYPSLAPLVSGVKLRKERSYTPSTGSILVYIGTNRRWAGDGQLSGHPLSSDRESSSQEASGEERSITTHQFFLPQSLTASLKKMDASGKLPGHEDEVPAYYMFNPCNIDAEAAPEGESVLYILIPAPVNKNGLHTAVTNWAEAGHGLAQQVIDDLESRAMPGLRESIQFIHIRTPADGEAEGWHGGGSFGIAPILSQSGVFRPQIKPYPIEGLYSVGASIHPGGGIPVVMLGAKLAAEQVSAFLEKRSAVLTGG